MTGADAYLVSRMGREEGPFSLAQLRMQVRSGRLRSDSMVRLATEGSGWFPAIEVPGLFSRRDWLTAVLLSVLVGFLAIDRFYLGYTTLGILKLVTLGGCGIWYLVDLVLIVTNSLPDADGLSLRR